MISSQTPVQSYPNPAAAPNATAKNDRTQLSDQKVNCLAKALYDNVAEAPDELAFRKGDVLTVLEQNTNGLEGWWLCSLRGRQGIAPGNRLRLLPGMYDPSGLGYAGGTPGQLGERPSHARRRSWKINPNKVITPQKIGEVYMYDVPVSARISETYDTPQPSGHLGKSHPVDGVLQGYCSYDTPPSPRAVNLHPAYDEPRPLSQQYDMPKPYLAYDKPRSYDHSKISAPLQIVPKTNDYDVPNSDSEAYDIPGPPRMVERQYISKTNDNSHPHLQNVVIPYDVPPVHTRSACSSCDLPSSKRSSGVSLMSTSSVSMLSPSSSESSLNTSLSLSSICGSNRSSMEQQVHEVYDIPPPSSRAVDSGLAKPHLNTVIPHPSSLLHFCHGNGHQDFAKHFMAQFYETPPTPRPTLQYVATEGVYDVPPQVTKDVSTILKNYDEDSMRRFSSSSTDSREFKENFPDIEGKELPLDLDGAMERLVKLHEEVQSTISKLFSFVSATWRKRDSMESKIFDIKTTCHKLCSVLEEFLSFIYGALANSTHSPDRTLCHKLGKLIMPLNDSNSVVQTTTQALDDKEWQVSKLATEDNSSTPDELDQLVACARVLVEDVRQVASFIQGNCTLIFKRSQFVIGNKPTIAPKPTDLKDRLITGIDNTGNMNCFNNQIVQDRPLPVPPQNDGLHHPLSSLENSNKEFINDYDYVNLESKESVERENEEIKAALPKQLHKSFENLVKQSYIPVDNDVSKFPVIKPSDGNWSSSLEPSELQVLKFYSIQLDTHMAFLTNAIDAFLLTIENNQPPKVFIGHSKFVIISAHKLVYIGDTVHRNISNSDIKNKVMQAANNLCDSLKTLVLSTKKAALQFPSVLAVQEMVDSVVDVSHLASELKTILSEAAKL